MASCKFVIPFQGPIEGLIEKARAAIEANGGVFEGDSTKCAYTIPSPVGKIAGTYNAGDGEIAFEITKKPIIVSCSKIENELRKLIESQVALNDFQMENFGVLKLNRHFDAPKVRVLDAFLVTATINLYIEDEETWGSNETWRGSKTNSVTLSRMYLPQQFMEFVVGMGGEIRIELMLTAQIADSQGAVLVDGNFRLFEGTSESTSDLDGERQFQIFIEPGSQKTYTSRVNNDDDGGDFAIAVISISNSRVGNQ